MALCESVHPQTEHHCGDGSTPDVDELWGTWRGFVRGVRCVCTHVGCCNSISSWLPDESERSLGGELRGEKWTLKPDSPL